jgi:hypothetical protein
MERRLEERLRAARAEAAALVTAARAAAERRETELTSELAAQERILEESFAAERHSREAELEAAARREVERFAGVSDARIAALARTLAEQLVAREGEGRPA